ncbi:MAG: FKBP-type peptidyl-prolyl cis-trans isomerase [Bacteroidales bacterium]
MYRLAFIILLFISNYPIILAQQLFNRWDSVCYALGITWQDDLSRHNMKISPKVFVGGISAYYRSDTTIFSLTKTYDFLEQHEKQLSSDTISPSLRDSLSFALGLAWAKNIYATGFPCPDTSLLLAGMQAKVSPKLAVKPARKLLTQYLDKLREEEYRGIKLLNENWLATNKNKIGVIVLPSGVQYKVINPPVNDRAPSDTSVFVLSYKAMLIDGTIFDQTQKPEKFYLSALIPGLHEILLSMRVGEKREIYIPYFLAFGTGGIKNTVPPFATVIYEIELVDVE